jgi:hypothetical protein
MPTQGSASSVTCDDDVLATADKLQFVVLYNFTDSTIKFVENARNTFDLGMNLCAMQGDDYFAIDLIVLSCCNLGHRATAITMFPSQTPRLLSQQNPDNTSKPYRSSHRQILKFCTAPLRHKCSHLVGLTRACIVRFCLDLICFPHRSCLPLIS